MKTYVVIGLGRFGTAVAAKLQELGNEVLVIDENEEEVFKQVSDFEFIVEGSMNLDDLNDRVDLELESEDYDSLGGFIIEHLDRLPDEKDEVLVENGVRLVVDSLDKNRIEKVHIYLPEDFYQKDDDDDSEDDE